MRELANQPPSPGVDNDFPDVPDENRPSDAAGEDDADDAEDDDGIDGGDDDIDD